ncbi:hypothetical protein [Paenibacillus sp. J22TS3]|uniref:hypothetical protein n=1 Tax=Paenibacillus sp. J22TS3 TaxID=2807192 RepID=UPI001B1F7DEB|nr:hypothetical protein [Paenibacillus sp. J22TS3]GIP23744.1 hypothetical protein J22TS3_40190 [Paenibacillus sp. J22TS3]
MRIIRNFRISPPFGFKGLELASLREINIAKEPDVQYQRGFYINFQGNMLGVVATPEGPAFFFNSDTYLLAGDNYQFRLKHKQDESIFYFDWNGASVLQIKYYRMLGGRAEEDLDRNMHEFLNWLIKAAKRKKFKSFYTVDDDSPSTSHAREVDPVRIGERVQ